MSPLLVRFGIVPALALLPLTLLRFWLELRQPESPIIKFASVFVLSVAFLVMSAILLLPRGISFPRFLAAMATFTLLVRVPLSILYAMAWSAKWTTPAGTPVRYVLDVQNQMHGTDATSALTVLTMTLSISFVVHMVIATLAWFITWAIAFRGKRPPCSAPAA